MRKLLRGLVVMSVLVGALYSRRPTEAAFVTCTNGGSCSITCEPCTKRSDCGLTDDGVQQGCICGWACP